MADKEAVEGNETEESLETEEVQQDVSDSMIVSMSQEEQTLLFPEYDFKPDVFIRAGTTALDEDDIINAAMQYRFDQKQQSRKARKQRNEQSETMQVSAMMNPKKAFVAKCMAQITDFRMPVKEANGSQGFRTYDKGSSVADRDNRAFYAQMLTNPELSDRVEGFLDYLAGRGTDAQQDFEELLFEHPQLLKTS
jgi:hypothetical protein